MLTEQEKDIIKSTVPVLEEYGTGITKTFYKNMFEAHPELLNMFNQTNQKVGDQPEALAKTVLAAARHIDNLEAILPAVIGIGHKHRALNVKPEHYPIVGKYLLAAIQHVLGLESSDKILSAWEKYYGVIAQVFIDVEKDMYKEADWDGFQPFEVINKEFLSDDIVRFTVKNDDLKFGVQAGQYITVKVKPENSDYEALRHYSISSIDTSKGLQFAVRREGKGDEKGVVSHHVFNDLNIGDTVEISAPAGDFLLDPSDDHLLFIAGGVGITPVMSMIEEAMGNNKNIKLIYSVRNESELPFKEELEALKEKIDVEVRFTHEKGRLSGKDFRDYVEHSVYLCGSMDFMQSMIHFLQDEGFEMSQINYEPFGPKMSISI